MLKIGILLSVILFFVATGAAFANGLKIYFIDVEQGAATLIVSPSNRSMLIDSGKDGMANRIKKAMEDAGITQIDYYLTTHYDADHYGSIDELVNISIPVVNAYDRGGKAYIPNSKKNSLAYKNYAAALGDRAIPISRGRTIPLDDRMLISVISTGGAVLGELSPVSATSENDMSIALLIQYGDFQFFTAGDLYRKSEVKIAQFDLVQEIDIYYANNHGSSTSSSLEFLQDLKPSLVVISNGSEVEFQHPSNRTLQMFANLERTPMVLQTNKYVSGGTDNGNVSDALIADLPPNDDQGTIKVEVDLESESYTVSYRDQVQGFNIKQAENNEAKLVIASLLPDPLERESVNESVTIKNKGVAPVSLNGMKLIDKSGRIWGLSGTTDGQGLKTVRRNRMPMALDDDGDTIKLLAPNLKVLDTFSYDSSEEGQVIETGH